MSQNTIRNIGVVGAGLIGESWTALFAAHGFNVEVYDPSPEALKTFRAGVAEKMDQLREFGWTDQGEITLHADLSNAVREVDFVQENAPEKTELKAQLLSDLERLAPNHTIFASSTSSLTWSQITGKMREPERAIIAHPFNPPHLLRLVEIYGVSEAVVSKSIAFYEALDREAVRIGKEAPGHVANRLSSALFREAVHLVSEGIATAEDVDRALKSGPGPRWASIGVFLGYHLGGGAGGIRHYLDHLGPSQEARWASLGQPSLTSEVKQTLVAQTLEGVGMSDIHDLAVERDRKLISMQKA